MVHHWQSMYRGTFWRSGPILGAAISGLEMAMWDILGKSLNAPVWQSCSGGAVRDRIRMYTRPHGNTPEQLAESAKTVVARGFTAMKFCPFEKVHIVDHSGLVDESAARVQAVREAVGPNVDILLDFHGRVSPTMAMWMEEAMRPFRPMFIEEPVLPENVDALVRVAQQSKTPIATGERLVTKWAVRVVAGKRRRGHLTARPLCHGRDLGDPANRQHGRNPTNAVLAPQQHPRPLQPRCLPACGRLHTQFSHTGVRGSRRTGRGLSQAAVCREGGLY